MHVHTADTGLLGFPPFDGLFTHLGYMATKYHLAQDTSVTLPTVPLGTLYPTSPCGAGGGGRRTLVGWVPAAPTADSNPGHTAPAG